MLSEISQDRVLLLSTHIVEDVAELCPNMAIMNRGEIIRSGSPQALVNALSGRIWTKVIQSNQDKSDSEWTIITSRMSRGERWVRVLSDSQPDSDFHAVETDLNDVYFTALLEKPQEFISV